MAVVRSPDFLRALIRETALATLIHQRRLTPLCGGQAPTAERTVGPARMIAESLTPKPGIREHNRRAAKKADHRDRALLRARRERPERCACEQGEEFTSPHGSIRASQEGHGNTTRLAPKVCNQSHLMRLIRRKARGA